MVEMRTGSDGDGGDVAEEAVSATGSFCGDVEKTYPSGHGGGGGGFGVAGADGAGAGLAVAVDGGDEVSPGDVGGGGEERELGAGVGEDRVLGAGAGDVGEEIAWAVGGGEGSGSGGIVGLDGSGDRAGGGVRRRGRTQ